jgi:vacuolar-type H+-ATPase subunit E/Vma4
MLGDLEQHLLEKIREEEEAKLQALKEQLKAEVEDRERYWQHREEELRKKVERKLDEERRERVSWAKLENRKALAEAKDAVIEDAMEALKAALQEFTSSQRYAKWLNSVVKRGLKELDGVVLVKKGDKALLNVKADVKEGAKILGGAIIESKDGKVRLDFSLDRFLAEKEDVMRRFFYDELFGEQ